jgi:hypothetical protein
MQMRFCDDLGPLGFSWIADEAMTRTSHALATPTSLGGATPNNTVWLVDPLAWPEAIERAGTLGEIVGVIQLLDRHNRDAAALARRLSVQHLVAPRSLPGTPFELVEIRRWKRWQEVALWWPEPRVLVAADALGTNPFFTVGDDRIGVHPFLRPTPPRQLARLDPAHVLVGHGEGLHGPGTAEEVRRALSRSRLSFLRWGAMLPFEALRRRRPSA